jgi:hypothetical protein
MASIENVCPQIERYSCRIDDETFTFEVRSASIVTDRPGHTVLQIAVFRRTASGQVPSAIMRVTAPFDEIERIPTLLTRAIEEWRLQTTTRSDRVH